MSAETPSPTRSRGFLGRLSSIGSAVDRLAWPQKLAILYVFALAMILYGVAIVTYRVFPYKPFKRIVDFVNDHPEAPRTTIWEKIQNDLDMLPMRHLNRYDPGTKRTYKTVALPDKNPRRPLDPKVFVAPGAERGWVAIYGQFDFASGLTGAVLLDPAGDIVHRWLVSEAGIGWKVRPDSGKFPHGFLVLKDGSVVAGFDFGTSLQRIGWCGNRIWARKGTFHHSLSLADDGSIWAIGPGYDDLLSNIDAETGKTIREVSLKAALKANPDIDIFGLRQRDFSEAPKWSKDEGGYWHINDVEALPAAWAAAFPQFAAGDLLVSMRSINLVFVIDPATLKIKWWRVGVTRRQHDPDWNADGTITLYDNNMHRKPSRIVRIDPKTMERTVVYDGAAENFYSRNRGKQQLLPGGNRLITVPEQSRAIEVDPAGQVVFEFYNAYLEPNPAALVVSEAVWLPEDFFSFKEPPKCAN